MKYKNCVYLSILYLILLQLLNNLILNSNCTLLTIISSYFFSAILLLFLFLIIIKLLAIKYDIWLIDKPNKIVNRRTFNLVLDCLKLSQEKYAFLTLKFDNQENIKMILENLSNYCITLNYYHQQINILVNNLENVKNLKNLLVQNKCKIYHNKCKYLK